ncbi:MAG: sensor histidine kinase [Vicinamibacterales bacterium]
MGTLRSRFATLVALAAIAPLLAYGLVSIVSLRRGTRESVTLGNANVVAQASARIGQYVDDSIKLLRSVAGVLHQPALTDRDRQRILTAFALDFPEFREVTLFGRDGAALASSRLARPDAHPIVRDDLDATGLHVSSIELDEDLLPQATLTLALDGTPSSTLWLVGKVSLEALWRFVDRIRVGERGFALLVDERGRLIAHGDPNAKERVARGQILDGHPLVAALRAHVAQVPVTREYARSDGETVLGAGIVVARTKWLVLLEQPTSEAYAVTTRLVRQLVVAIGAALVFTILWGVRSAGAVIRPIDTLIAGTRRLAAGELDARVTLTGDAELRRLGEAFNVMADRLTELQAETVRQERQAMFGKVAAGLAHDLAHPVQNISNNCKLMLRMYDDAEYRSTFQRVIEREVGIMRRMLDDLKNLARPMALERFGIDVNRSVRDVVDGLRQEVAEQGLELRLDLSAEALTIAGDLFALGRVYRNLIVNAIQATPRGGRVTVGTRREGEVVHIAVSDTGCGIDRDRLQAIFDDFVTTKRRGLGLGLAISRKIVEQLGGTISVASEVGVGTTFTLEFPSAQSTTEAIAG